MKWNSVIMFEVSNFVVLETIELLHKTNIDYFKNINFSIKNLYIGEWWPVSRNKKKSSIME